jgi:hypothetical protein
MTGETNATVTLNRQNGKRDLWRAYRVIVDGNQMAVLNQEETCELSLPPGSHEIWIKLDWTRSPKVKLDLAEGSQRHLQCRAGGSPWMVPIDSWLRPSRYIELTESGTGEDSQSGG